MSKFVVEIKNGSWNRITQGNEVKEGILLTGKNSLLGLSKEAKE